MGNHPDPYISSYRDRDNVLRIVNNLCAISKKELTIMEVCGGHTMAIRKYGIHSLLPKNIHLKSGPGCPVCVSSRKFIDQAIAYSRLENVIVTTFGDLVRIPGSTSSLEKEKTNGRDVRIVYSSIDALQIARQNPDKNIVFLGIGFETTAPTTAASILSAVSHNLHNYFVFSSHKIMPPVMEALVREGVKLDGFIGPGHVATITGSKIFDPLPAQYHLGCVVSGFEPVDILQSVFMLARQKENNTPKVEIEYTRAVSDEGNLKAQDIMNEVFVLRDEWWRGFGNIPLSGLAIKDKYAEWDAEKRLQVEVEETMEEEGCICGEILKGNKNPRQCRLFNRECTPANPVGACMVSSEGACNAFYKYRNEN